MRLRKRHLPFIALLGVAAAVLPSLAVSATTATVEALNEGSGLYGERHFWSPSQVAVTASGGVVTFANNSPVVPHGIIWKSTPATPSCEEGAGKVPVGPGHFGHSWSGACTFTQKGTYTYYCSVHGEAMSGAVYVNATGTLQPTASTEAATPVTETAATLRGSVNPMGQPTFYHFNYGASSSYGQETSEVFVGEDSAAHPVSALLTGLSAGVTYHFQLVAKYDSGASTVLGADRIFIAASSPPPPSETTTTSTTTSAPPPPSTTTTATTTTAVTSTPAPSPAGSLGTIGGSPLAGSASTAVKVASAQHGSSIHGSLDISPAGAGARLEVDLLAGSASLARRHTKQIRIGRLLRASLAAGRLSFSVPLNVQAKRALHRRRRLPVIVQITLTPLHGAPVITTRSVTLHG